MQNYSDNGHTAFELKSVVNTSNKNEKSFNNPMEITSPINSKKAFLGQAQNNVINMPFVNLKDTVIIKKDGTQEEYNVQKVVNAVKKSAARMLVEFTDNDIKTICAMVDQRVANLNSKEVQIMDMHNIVESVLETVNPKVAQSYRNYRNYKQDFLSILDKVYQESQKILYIGHKENSNSDSALVSTKRSLVFNQLNKELYKKFFLTVEDLQAIREGYIYIHDMSARRDTMN